jgi:formyl-CoA transferase
MATAKTKGALDGIKVVDLSRVLGGPTCTQALADHGADVIKVEPPQGDETRAWGPPFVDGAASYYLGANRNKRGIAIDLSQGEGRDLVLRFLADADVLVENFRAGTLEKWGLGYDEVLADRFPRLIHCRVSGFGGDGPLGGYPGYDAVVQAMAGMMSINGTPESGAVRMGIPIVDLAAGMVAMQGVLLALYERERSGRGQFVEASLYNTAVSLLHPHAANWFLSGKVPVRTGNAHPNVVPYDKFETATGEIFVGVGNDRQFAKLCALLGDDDLAADSRFRSNAERGANRADLTVVLQRLMRGADGRALCAELLRAGVPAGPVHDIAEVLEHPHTAHHEMVVAHDGYRGTGIPAKLSRTPGAVRRAPPTFGQHGREILAEHGIGDDGFDALVAAGVVVTEIPPR